MKPIQPTEPQPVSETNSLPKVLVDELMADDLLPEYRFDYSKARPNRFAARLAETRMVALEADVAAVFTSAEAVNAVLRALIQTMPQPKVRETV